MEFIKTIYQDNSFHDKTSYSLSIGEDKHQNFQQNVLSLSLIFNFKISLSTLIERDHSEFAFQTEFNQSLKDYSLAK